MKSIGDYTDLEPIGKGGMGVVYKAKNPGSMLTPVVAIKVMFGDCSDEERQRFLREAWRSPTTRESSIVAGSTPPERIRRCASSSIVITGYVEDLLDYYDSCRVFVVPLRFGAGINYKLTEAMSYGIPAVVSPLAANGLALRDGNEVFVGAEPAEFVHKVEELYTNESLWKQIQSRAQDYIRETFAPEFTRSQLESILGTQSASGTNQ